MTEEDKQLLLIDICARLPYGVKVKYYRDKCDGTLNTVNFKFKTVWITSDNGSNDSLDFESIGKGVWQLKPYLRSMSSMTKKEKKEYRSLSDSIIVTYGPLDFTFDLHHIRLGIKPGNPHETIDDFIDMSAIDWLNAHHFDYRDLIDKGLALEAPEGMYEK